MSELEIAYRRRVQFSIAGFLLTSFVLTGFSHFADGPIFFVLIVAALASVGLAVKGERLLFPLAWKSFDALRPSPVLEDEARALAKQLGVPPVRLRLRPGYSKWPMAKWKGRTLVVPVALRELPEGERRFALARSLVVTADAIHFFAAQGAMPLIYVSFAAWCFDIRPLSAIIGCATVLAWILCTIQVAKRGAAADARAIEITRDPEAALAYWGRMNGLGSPRAPKRIAALEATVSGLSQLSP